VTTPTLPLITGRLGLYLAISVVAFPLITGLVELGLTERKADLDRALEKDKYLLSYQLDEKRNALAIDTEDNRSRFEVNKLFLESYRGASAAAQLKTVQILVTLYPKEFADVAKIFDVAAASSSVRLKVQASADTAQAISQQLAVPNRGVTTTATTEERRGFQFLVARDVASARKAFGRAYAQFPAYHNVDEIFHLVLTEKFVAGYQNASVVDREKMLREVAADILDKYSWGVPKDSLSKLKALAGR
jgi:hypothetical protein